jgi:hypothetical protein
MPNVPRLKEHLTVVTLRRGARVAARTTFRRRKY